MPDDKSKTGYQDRTRINIHEPYEVAYWTKRLGVTAKELQAIVAQVGPYVSAVENYLSQRR